MVTIAFDGRVLNERGTTVAVFDFAEAAERELGARSIIFHQTGTPEFNPKMVEQIAHRFEPVGYTDIEDMRRKIKESGADLSYAFYAGPHDDRRVPGVKSIAHALFQDYRPKGDVYAYISEWLAAHMGGQAFVPLIVNLPPPDGSMREDWGWPDDAVVIGRHGGFDQFDLPFVKETIAEALARRADLHFAFLNTQAFIDHPRVRFVPPVYDLVEKANFIAGCDAMLHARKAGEGFGLAPAEFLAQDKPVITWRGGKDRNHLWMVPDHSLVYRTAVDLLAILLEFQSVTGTGYYRAATEAYTPAAVMQRFHEVFIDAPAGVHPPIPGWLGQTRAKLETRAIVLQGRLWRDRGLRQARALRAKRPPDSGSRI